MQLRLKLVLLSGVPIVVALVLMAATMQRQTLDLVREEQAQVQKAFMQSKETELRNYVELARNTMMRIAAQPGDVGARKEAALATLSRMQFGDDGYFFVYDQHGELLIDPTTLPLAGVEFCDPNDPVGADAAQRILATAQRGGGAVRYQWKKPSSQEIVPKLGYVLTMPEWNWTIGTGIYLDDVDQALAALEASARANIEATRRRLFGIAALCVVLIGLGGLLLNLQDHRVSSDKLRRLARRVVHSQEEERVRLARELHDGVVQVLASSKFLLETAQLQLADPVAGGPEPPRRALDQGLAHLSSALVEIRRVSHALRPALLDDLGLAAALALLAEQVQQRSGMVVRLVRHGAPTSVPPEHGTALFRIAQEALHNCCEHAQASEVEVLLRGLRGGVLLVIHDNGCGFDTRRVFEDGARGIGLRNMRERAESLGGVLTIDSDRLGTRLEAWLPLPQSASPGERSQVPTQAPREPAVAAAREMSHPLPSR